MISTLNNQISAIEVQLQDINRRLNDVSKVCVAGDMADVRKLEDCKKEKVVLIEEILNLKLSRMKFNLVTNA